VRGAPRALVVGRPRLPSSRWPRRCRRGWRHHGLQHRPQRHRRSAPSPDLNPPHRRGLPRRRRSWRPSV